jgi:hypothetical protein
MAGGSSSRCRPWVQILVLQKKMSVIGNACGICEMWVTEDMWEFFVLLLHLSGNLKLLPWKRTVKQNNRMPSTWTELPHHPQQARPHQNVVPHAKCHIINLKLSGSRQIPKQTCFSWKHRFQSTWVSRIRKSPLHLPYKKRDLLSTIWLFFFFFNSTGVWTLGHTLARQALFTWSTPPAHQLPFFYCSVSLFQPYKTHCCPVRVW